MDATGYTLPTFMRFDAKMLNAVAILIGQGEEWPTDGTAHLGRDAWELAIFDWRVGVLEGGGVRTDRRSYRRRMPIR